MFGFVCPVCGEALSSDGKSLRCSKGHCYDIARGGYVNLLMSNAPGAKRHGDDAMMIKARRDFLEKGYYAPLRDAICRVLAPFLESGASVLDAGCGDGWYTAALAEHLAQEGAAADILGVDISRDALNAAARRSGEIGLAVASVYKLPVAEKSCSAVLSIFAPLAQEEFARVLKDNGLLLRVVPLEEHLWELKQAVYDVPRENPPDTETVQGFELAASEEVRYAINLQSNEDICNLFAMTPYYYKTGQKDQEKLQHIGQLEVRAAFGIRLWRKKS